MHLKTSQRTAELLILLFTAILLLASVSFFVGAVAAQTNVTNQTSEEIDTEPETPTRGELIESGLVLLNSSYHDGQAILTFRVESTRSVTLTDAGAFWQGGEMRQRTIILQPGTHTVEFPVTETPSGKVGVTIATANTLYAEPIRVPTNGLAFLDGLTSQTALGWGAASAFLWFCVMGTYVLYVEGGEPEAV